MSVSQSPAARTPTHLVGAVLALALLAMPALAQDPV